MRPTKLTKRGVKVMANFEEKIVDVVSCKDIKLMVDAEYGVRIATACIVCNVLKVGNALEDGKIIWSRMQLSATPLSALWSRKHEKD